MRLEAVGKRYGLRQPWVVRGVSARRAAGPADPARRAGTAVGQVHAAPRRCRGARCRRAGKVTGRPHTGYVPERFPGGLPFSGRDYLLHLARVHGLRGAPRPRGVEEWLEPLRRGRVRGQPLRSLSKGMCQKMAIAPGAAGPARPAGAGRGVDGAGPGRPRDARRRGDGAGRPTAARCMFVDHDQARLAGRISERWRFDGEGRGERRPRRRAPTHRGGGVRSDAVVVVDAGRASKVTRGRGSRACRGCCPAREPALAAGDRPRHGAGDGRAVRRRAAAGAVLGLGCTWSPCAPERAAGR